MLRASLPTTIDIRMHLDDDIGIIEADPTQLHQVLMGIKAFIMKPLVIGDLAATIRKVLDQCRS